MHPIIVSRAHGIFRRVWLFPLAILLACALPGCTLTLGSDGGSSVGQTSTSGSTTTVNVRILKGAENATLIEAPVTIQGHGPYNFIIDTGASVSLIDSSIANKLNLPVVGSGKSVSGVAGSETAIPIQVTNWSVGKLSLPTATVTKGSLLASESGQGLQGLLGSDVLSRYGKVTIDYTHAQVTFYNTSSTTASTSASSLRGVGDLKPLAVSAAVKRTVVF